MNEFALIEKDFLRRVSLLLLGMATAMQEQLDADISDISVVSGDREVTLDSIATEIQHYLA